MIRMNKTSAKTGLPPGTLVHVGEARQTPTRLTRFRFSEGSFREDTLERLDGGQALTVDGEVTWFKLNGLARTDLLESFGARLGIHPLVLEDILHTSQRPKVEVYADHVFIVLRSLIYTHDDGGIVSEQVSLVMGPGYLLTVEENGQEVFAPLIERLTGGRGQIRASGADYLTYAAMDAVVDHYFVILENMNDQIEALEEELLESPSRDTLQKLHTLKRELLNLRHGVWPLRDVLSTLDRGTVPLFLEATRPYLRDVYDHTLRIIELIETMREMLSSMLDIYLSSVSNRMNEVMKTLTVIATVFIPLTFIVGIYGMNFAYMPELREKWGYPLVWLVMVGVTAAMLTYFKRKKWW